MPSIYALAVSWGKQEECPALWLCGQGARFHTLWCGLSDVDSNL